MADNADEAVVSVSIPEVYNVWDHIDITAAMAAQVKLNVPSEDVPVEDVAPVPVAPAPVPRVTSTPAPPADVSADTTKEN
jgi:hypothetical protein